MTVRPYRQIIRRKCRQIRVGNVLVGGDAPISVQTMTNTPTSDPKATIEQIRRIEEAGADIVRVSCPDEESTAALKEIVRAAKIPIVAWASEVGVLVMVWTLIGASPPTGTEPTMIWRHLRRIICR